MISPHDRRLKCPVLLKTDRRTCSDNQPCVIAVIMKREIFCCVSVSFIFAMTVLLCHISSLWLTVILFCDDVTKLVHWLET